jgi:hypothetical protein
MWDSRLENVKIAAKNALLNLILAANSNFQEAGTSPKSNKIPPI